MAYCKKGTIIAVTKYVTDDGRTQHYKKNLTYETIGNNFLYVVR